MGHKKLDISLTNEKLEAAMYAEMYERKIQCKQLHKTLHLAASLIEVRQISYKLNFNCWLPIQMQVGYHQCAFEEKKAIAMYNWYSIPAYIYIYIRQTCAPQACYLHWRQGMQRRCPFRRFSAAFPPRLAATGPRAHGFRGCHHVFIR